MDMSVGPPNCSKEELLWQNQAPWVTSKCRCLPLIICFSTFCYRLR